MPSEIYIRPTSSRVASRYVPSVLVTPPAEEPVSLTDVKSHCRVDGDFENDQVARQLQMAREAVEIDAEIRLITQTRRQYFDTFPECIELRDPPVQSITSITYTDVSGDTQTLSASAYNVDIGSRPCVIVPAYGYVWPPVLIKPRCVAVTFVCGYGAASAVPATAKQAILLQVGNAYRNREMSKQDSMSYDVLISRLQWRACI